MENKNKAGVFIKLAVGAFNKKKVILTPEECGFILARFKEKRKQIYIHIPSGNVLTKN